MSARGFTNVRPAQYRENFLINWFTIILRKGDGMESYIILCIMSTNVTKYTRDCVKRYKILEYFGFGLT